MKTETDNILEKIGRKDGMTVPDGYFADFQAKMEAMLPFQEDVETAKKIQAPRSFWGRVRPYVYMAAMFAGVWCMVKMFSMMSPSSVDLSIDNNEVLTKALSDDNFIYDYLRDDVSDREWLEEIYLDSISVDDMIPADSLGEEEL
jgi:hypothetical protein